MFSRKSYSPLSYFPAVWFVEDETTVPQELLRSGGGASAPSSHRTGREDPEDDYELEQHLEAARSVGSKLYAKPVEIVQPAATVEAPEPILVADPLPVVEPVVDLSPHKEEFAALTAEMAGIQRDIKRMTDEAMARARRRRDEEAVLLLLH